MELLFEKQRGKDGGVDSYYRTPYKNVFVHLFAAVDGKQYFSANKLAVTKDGCFRLEERQNFLGLQSVGGISRKSFEEAFADAKKLRNATYKTKTIGFSHWPNKELVNELREKLA